MDNQVIEYMRKYKPFADMVISSGRKILRFNELHKINISEDRHYFSRIEQINDLVCKCLNLDKSQLHIYKTPSYVVAIFIIQGQLQCVKYRHGLGVTYFYWDDVLKFCDKIAQKL